MKQITLIILAITLSMSLTAQEKEKQREVGITFSSFDNFGLSFKTGTSNSLWRFNTLLVTGNNLSNNVEDSITYEDNRFGATLSFGKEFRKKASENFEIRFGADLSFNHEYSKSKTSNKRAILYEPGINLVIGFNYLINNNFIIGAEILPGLRYSIFQDSEFIEDMYFHTFKYGLMNNSTLISIAYKF